MDIIKCKDYSTPNGVELGVRLVDSEGMMFESEVQCAKYHEVKPSVINSISTINKPCFNSKKLGKKVAVIIVSDYEFKMKFLYKINERLLKQASTGKHCYLAKKDQYKDAADIYGIDAPGYEAVGIDDSYKFEIKEAIKLPKNHILYQGGSRWVRQIKDDSYGWDASTGEPLKYKNLFPFKN